MQQLSLSLLTDTSMRFLTYFHHNSVAKKILGRGNKLRDHTVRHSSQVCFLE